ncbi:hypothetical protein ALC60_11099 [Trachymyrmex zeteki]|uniref:Nuclease HARBI1 n=1 Tax=Mycetomoellerius zeteki TaxID=64791 RepID=A0A151WPU7_9HYME|nr:hypothetical protein ALC60_11099 [Trachymyrmex zeteki]
MKFPTTNNEIKKQQLEFYKIFRFPRVVGCIDCTHVRVQSFGKYIILFIFSSYIPILINYINRNARNYYKVLNLFYLLYCRY